MTDHVFKVGDKGKTRGGPPKRRIQGWVNFFEDAPCMGPFMTKAEADASYNVAVCCAKAQGKEPVARIACTYVDIEEGEGL